MNGYANLVLPPGSFVSPMDKIEEAIATLERARSEAIFRIAGGDPSYVAQLERAQKGITILNEIKGT